MTADDRLRPHPHERLSGTAHRVDLVQAARDLRGEPHPAVEGHRQIALVRDGPTRVILFAFEPGALLKEHRAPGGISIHALTGHLEVTADGTTYDLPAGALLSLAAGVTHDVRALERSDMLLTVVRT